MKANENKELLIPDKLISYPICKIKWQNTKFNDCNRYLTALDLTALSSTPYVYLENMKELLIRMVIYKKYLEILI